MAATVSYNNTPNFSHLSLADSASVDDALKYVLQDRHKEDQGPQLVKNIIEKTGLLNVGDLRRLTDHDWRSLEGVPAICRIYLKYVIRSSARPGGVKAITPSAAVVGPAPTPKNNEVLFMELLQQEFNYGQPFEMSLYNSHVTMLASMGFGQDSAMEALCITENKSAEAALEVLLTMSDKDARAKRRQEVADRLGRRGALNSGGQSSQALYSQLASLQQRFDQEKVSRTKAENDLKTYIANTPRKLYKAYLKGVISDELINIQEFQQMKMYREKKKITDADHLAVLKELNLSVEQFEEMKKFDVKAKGDNECVVCLDRKKTHVIFNCMHLCLCDVCVDTVTGKSNKCPMCSKKITKVVRIFT